MKHLLLALALSTSAAVAHDDHDWRLDYEAYLSVQYEAPLIFKGRSDVSPRRVDMAFFREKLAVLTGEAPFEGRLITERETQRNLDVARAFLRAEYQKLGFETELHAFGSGVNFVAEKKGTREPGKVLVLSSHIDTVGNKGANDNGTGTIGLLAVAREIAQKDYGITIRILGFDREEVGLRGSDAYVAAVHRQQQIVGNINFEMMGVNRRNDGAFHLIDCDRADSKFLSDAVRGSIAELNLGLSVVKTCTSRSDHASFWRRNIPAVVISENFFGGDADPCYHKRCDVMDERLNYPYMQRILAAVLAATEKLAE
jgi:hypothetical protein